jgi:hypothetical protein
LEDEAPTADVVDIMFINEIKHRLFNQFHFRFPSPLGEGAEGG